MTEVTRVPIQPVAKGSLTKLWLGVIAAILLGGALAWSAVPKGLSLETLVEGEGPNPQVGDLVFVKYIGKIAETGEQFDEWQPEPLPVPGIFPEGSAFPVQEGATIDGFFKGLQQMQKGGKYELFIPAEQAYGAEPPPGSNLPENADLIFEMELVDFFNEDQVRQKIGIMEQAMQQMGPQGPAGPGGPAQGPAGPPPGAAPPPPVPAPSQ